VNGSEIVAMHGAQVSGNETRGTETETRSEKAT
jgi:hypothetical protein